MSIFLVIKHFEWQKSENFEKNLTFESNFVIKMLKYINEALAMYFYGIPTYFIKNALSRSKCV